MKVGKTYWFKRKTYGWGWTPATWQGWLVILVFILFQIWNVNRGVSAQDAAIVAGTLPGLLISIAVLLLITYLTGESPRWQWGERK